MSHASCHARALKLAASVTHTVVCVSTIPAAIAKISLDECKRRMQFMGQHGLPWTEFLMRAGDAAVVTMAAMATIGLVQEA
jgi:hypothetical protein